MDKKWFVFLDDHHRGPFSTDAMVELYNKDVIKEDFLVWCEELKDWSTFAQEFPQEINVKKQKDFEKWDDANPPPLPEKIVINTDDIPLDESEMPHADILGLPGRPHSKKTTSNRTKNSSPSKQDENLQTQTQSKSTQRRVEREVSDVFKINDDDLLEFPKEFDMENIDTNYEEIRDPTSPLIRKTTRYRDEKVYPIFVRFLDWKSQFDPYMKKLWWSLIGVVAIFVFSLYGTRVYKRYYLYDFKKPVEMSQVDYLKITEIIKKDPQKFGVVYQFAVSKDGQSVWLATNIHGSGSMTLKIASIPDKILSKDVILAESTSDYSKFLAKFSNFEFEKGTKIHSGYYVASIVGHNVQKKKGMFSSEELDNTIDLTGTIILGKFQKQYVLESRLANFKNQLWEEKLAVFDTLIEKYRAIKALSNTTQDLLHTHLDQMKSGKFYERFEKPFANQVGRVIKDMYDDNLKNIEQLKIERPEVSKLFQTQVEYYTKLGEIGASIVKSIKKRSTIGARTRKKLYKFYDKKIEELNSELDARIKQMQRIKEVVRPKSSQTNQ